MKTYLEIKLTVKCFFYVTSQYLCIKMKTNSVDNTFLCILFSITIEFNATEGKI